MNTQERKKAIQCLVLYNRFSWSQRRFDSFENSWRHLDDTSLLCLYFCFEARYTSDYDISVSAQERRLDNKSRIESCAQIRVSCKWEVVKRGYWLGVFQGRVRSNKLVLLSAIGSCPEVFKGRVRNKKLVLLSAIGSCPEVQFSPFFTLVVVEFL